ncbi:hypothetical protein [Arthrobacter sp. ov118]|uniref:hypothetical protein n=1 Tax=Arthrobacter sp. ov118 TaxID=1761747 RepID=UPI0008F2A2A4|nr:hypothetical protein [Arthrobacter sp. ov118]SFT96711.1 hypothetical protein SAMN04487915_106183 [Arthrobacter sp. ov118]
MNVPLVRNLGWIFGVLLLLAFGAVMGASATTFFRVLAGPGQTKPILESITASLTALALIVAIAAYRFSAVKGKRDLFLTLHEHLVAPEVQEGRRLLHEAGSYSDVEAISRKNRKLVNRSLALYETLAMYTLNKDVYRKDVWSAWGWTIANLRQKIQWFMDMRENVDEYRSWPHLRRLLTELEKSPPRRP